MGTTNDDALLLIAHGTRDELGLAQTRAVAEQLAQQNPHLAVELCFLELAEPTMADGFQRCAARGARRLHVSPLLLFAAGHAQRDIPQAVAEAGRRFPKLEIHQAPALGCHPRLLDLSALRYSEAVASRPEVPNEQTLLLMVGRGSTEAQANSEMARFARLRWEQRPLGWLETCYVAMARPSLAEALRLVPRLGHRRIVVQPHLLFSGELLRQVRDDVQQAAIRWPDCEWLVTEPLGPHPLLLQAVMDTAGLSQAATTPSRAAVVNSPASS